MFLRLAFIAAVLLAGCVAVSTDRPGISSDPGGDLRVGQRISGNFKIGGIVFPLIPGDWILAAVSSTRGGGDNTGQARFEGAILIEERSGKLSRLIEVSTNAMGVGNGFGWARNEAVCDKKDIIFNGSPSWYNDTAGRCWTIDHTRVPAAHIVSSNENIRVGPLLRGAYTFMANRGIDSAVMMVYTTHWVTNRSSYVSASYYFNPSLAGIYSSYVAKEFSEWAPSRYPNLIDKKEFIENIKLFGEEMTPIFARGVDGQLQVGAVTEARSLKWSPVPAVPPPVQHQSKPPETPPARQVPAATPVLPPSASPSPPATNAPASSVEQRLQNLRDLRSRGVISPEEHDRRRQEIIQSL